jgi:hypothetical protein
MNMGTSELSRNYKKLREQIAMGKGKCSHPRKDCSKDKLDVEVI